MKLQEIASLLDAKDISTDGDIDAIDIDTAYASDLMSDVLAFCKPGTLLLTGLTNIQIIRTAQMMDLPAIIFVRGKTPLEDTIKLAHDNGIPILVTKHSMFKVCGVLYSKGLKPIVIGEDQAMGSPVCLEYRVESNDFMLAGAASNNIKNTLKMLGVNSAICRRVAVITYEAEINLVIHGDGGMLKAEITENHVVLTAEDQGPGIENVDKAMTEGFSTASDQAREMGFGAGMGLPNIKRNSDEFYIKSEVGKGTKLTCVVYFNK